MEAVPDSDVEIIPDSEPDHSLVVHNISDHSDDNGLLTARSPQSTQEAAPDMEGRARVTDEHEVTKDGPHKFMKIVESPEVAMKASATSEKEPTDLARGNRVSADLRLPSSSPVRVLSKAFAYRNNDALHLSQRTSTCTKAFRELPYTKVEISQRPRCSENTNLALSDDEIGLLLICPYCMEAWTARKTVKAKRVHVTKCARLGYRSSKDLVKEDKVRKPKKPLGASQSHTLATASVNSCESGRHPRQGKVTQSIKRPSALTPVEENTPLFISRAAIMYQASTQPHTRREDLSALPATQEFEPSRVSCLYMSPKGQDENPRTYSTIEADHRSLWSKAALIDTSPDRGERPNVSKLDSPDGSQVQATSQTTSQSVRARSISSQAFVAEAISKDRPPGRKRRATRQENETCRDSLTPIIASCLSQDAKTWRRVLLYEPLEINYLLEALQLFSGLQNCTIKDLTQSLDDLSVCFWNAKTASKRRQRRHKQGRPVQIL